MSRPGGRSPASRQPTFPPAQQPLPSQHGGRETLCAGRERRRPAVLGLGQGDAPSTQGKAKPKGPGTGGPSLRLLLFLTLLSYFLFSLLSAQPSLLSAMTITKPRWSRTLSSCLPHDLHQAMALSVRAAGRLVSVMTDTGRRGARCPSMCLRVGKAQLCLPASP